VSDRTGITRRVALGAGVAGAAALALASTRDDVPAPVKAARLPVAYVPHGGGPWPFVELGYDATELDALAAYLRSLRELGAAKALLVVSAHWEERVPTVMTGAQPPLLYDYSGFPPEAYRIAWGAPGSPVVAARVRELLGGAGFATAEDAARGFDHGTFVPFKLTYPEAEVPALQLSLKAGLDPAEHLAMGRALAPLRDEGVLILGSGMSYHNMAGFRSRTAVAEAEAFDAWLRDTTTLDPASRERRLAAWAEAPDARAAHPREEHLLPLMVVAGAAGADAGRCAFEGTVFGKRISAHQFG
jgi:aromatic ring-opening dioxygenase catalytic subunit (LigB family)